jgi:hypothetical protein
MDYFNDLFNDSLFDDNSYDGSTESFADIPLTDEDDAMIFLEALYESCSEEEFIDIMKESAYDLDAAGLVPAEVCEAIVNKFNEEGSIATEAVKKIVIKDWKSAKFNKIERKTAINMAKRNNDPNYKKYKFHRDKMKAFRSKIYQKYGSKAKSETRRIIRNSKRKASTISTPQGKSITTKMDEQIKRLDQNGRNKTAIKK